jgi:hypothetical protein
MQLCKKKKKKKKKRDIYRTAISRTRCMFFLLHKQYAAQSFDSPVVASGLSCKPASSQLDDLGSQRPALTEPCHRLK